MKEKILSEFRKKFKLEEGLLAVLEYDGISTWWNDACLDDIENFIAVALDDYADWKIKECLPEKINVEFTSIDDLETSSDKSYDLGWNACIDYILNKDKKK